MQVPEQQLAEPSQKLRRLTQSAQVPEVLRRFTPSQLLEQQSPPLVQVPPLAVQAAIAMQVPPTQLNPEQQAASLVQVSPAMRQAQVPPQTPEQHWALVVQAPPKAVQAGGVTQAPLTQFWPGPQQMPLQQAWVVGQQVVPPGQKAWPLGHWQLALVQTVPPVQTLPQPAQFWFVPTDVQAPPQQPVPDEQQAT